MTTYHTWLESPREKRKLDRLKSRVAVLAFFLEWIEEEKKWNSDENVVLLHPLKDKGLTYPYNKLDHLELSQLE